MTDKVPVTKGHEYRCKCPLCYIRRYSTTRIYSLEDRVVRESRSMYAGRVWEISGLMNILPSNWSEVLFHSPKAIRPDNWPEPNGWFWGWNRERSMRDRGYTWGTRT